MKQKCLLLFLLLPLFGVSQTSNLSGVVTYFFNKNFGNKPDLGAKVYVIDSSTNFVFNPKTVDSFVYAKTYRGLYSTYMRIFSNYDEIAKKYEGKKKNKAEYDQYKAKADEAKKDADNYYSIILNYGVETDAKFESLDKRTAESIVQVNENNSLLKTVDGNGNYAFNIKPGTYYVFIVSKNRNSLSISEVMGKIYCKKVIIKENTTTDVSNNFDLD